VLGLGRAAGQRQHRQKQHGQHPTHAAPAAPLFIFGQQPVHGGLKEKVQDSTNQKLRDQTAKSAWRFNVLVQWRRCHFDSLSLAVTLPAWPGLNYTHLVLYEPFFVLTETTNGNFGFGREAEVHRPGGRRPTPAKAQVPRARQ